PAQHGEHASLFRPWPAFARGAGFGLHLARLMPRANERPRCNGSPLARGDDFDCRCFDFGQVGSQTNACLRRSAHRNSLDPDRFEALFGDAKRHGSSFGIASPGQERAIGADLFQQPSADELIHGLAKRFARNVCRQVDSAIIAPRSRGQNDELGIGESCHRDPPLRWCGVIVAATTTAPPRPCSRRGRIPRARRAPGMVTLPLCSRTNASPFWIMLLLSLGVLEHGMIERGGQSARLRIWGSGVRISSGARHDLARFRRVRNHGRVTSWVTNDSILTLTLYPVNVLWPSNHCASSGRVCENPRFELCRSYATTSLPASSACNDSAENWADVRGPSCFKDQKSSRTARSRRDGLSFPDRGQVNFPGSVARAAL